MPDQNHFFHSSGGLRNWKDLIFLEFKDVSKTIFEHYCRNIKQFRGKTDLKKLEQETRKMNSFQFQWLPEEPKIFFPKKNFVRVLCMFIPTKRFSELYAIWKCWAEKKRATPLPRQFGIRFFTVFVYFILPPSDCFGVFPDGVPRAKIQICPGQKIFPDG